MDQNINPIVFCFFFALLYFNKYLITSKILELFLEPVLNLRGETYQREKQQHTSRSDFC